MEPQRLKINLAKKPPAAAPQEQPPENPKTTVENPPEESKKRKREDEEEVIEETPVQVTKPIINNSQNPPVPIPIEDEDSDEEDVEPPPPPVPIRKRTTRTPKQLPPSTASQIGGKIVETFRSQMPQDITTAVSNIAVKGIWGGLFVGFLVLKGMLQNAYLQKLQQPHPSPNFGRGSIPTNQCNIPLQPGIHPNTDFSAFR